MRDVFEVANLLVEDAVRIYGGEIDIIAYSGSHARGEARDDSDLDLFYVPADGKKPPIGRTFLLEGVLFDFWAIPWSTMEGFATGHIRGWSFAPGLIHHTKILHARTDQQSARLAALQQQILDLQKPEARPKMVRRALRNFGSAMVHLANLRLAVLDGNLTDVRYAGWQVIQSVWECLALSNQVFFERGLAKGLGEAAKFKDKPERLGDCIATITTSADFSRILAAGEELVFSTRRILRRIQQTIPASTTVSEQFRQLYPEVKDKVGKLLAACARGDSVAAHAEALHLQREVALTLHATEQGAGGDDFNLYSELEGPYSALQLPDLIASCSGSLQELAAEAGRFDEKLRLTLSDQSVDLCEFKSLDELAESLNRD